MRFMGKCFIVALLAWGGFSASAQNVFAPNSTNQKNPVKTPVNGSCNCTNGTCNCTTTETPTMLEPGQLGDGKPAVAADAKAALAMLAAKKQKLADTIAFLSQQYTELTKQLLEINHRMAEATDAATKGWDLSKWKIDDNPDSDTWLETVPVPPPAKNPAAVITGDGKSAQPHAAVPPAQPEKK